MEEKTRGSRSEGGSGVEDAGRRAGDRASGGECEGAETTDSRDEAYSSLARARRAGLRLFLRDDAMMVHAPAGVDMFTFAIPAVCQPLDAYEL